MTQRSLVGDPAERRYIERLRAMTGEERLLKALDLCRTVWRVARDAVRNEQPGIGDAELKERLRRRVRGRD